MNTFDVVVIGDANIDLVVVGSSQVPKPGQEIFVENMMLHVGGGAALFSISLAKLGLGVAFAGVLGNDLYGNYIRDQFAQYGIDTSLIETSKIHHTGISIAFNPDTDRSFMTYAGSNKELSLDGLNLDRIGRGRHVHMTGYRGRENHEPFLTAAKKLKEAGVTLSCDVGWDDSGEWYDGVFELMKHFDVFLMNETEALHYTGRETSEDALAHMAAYGSHIVVKLGPDGSVAMKDGTVTRGRAYPVEAVDTTGAGDSFNAGYLYGFLKGEDVATSLKYGNACGALSVSAYGGSTGTPNLKKLEEFLLRHEGGAPRAAAK